MNEYRLAVDLEVLEQLLKTDEAQRQQIVDLLARLRHQPFLTGEFREIDDTGRSNEVVLAGNTLVFFWSDHAVKTVRVTKLEFIEDDQT